MINELFGILCLTNSCTFFLYFFLLSTFRILFRGIRDGSLSLFLLRFMVSFKSSPFSKLIELSRLYSEHAVPAVQFLYPVIKDSEGFCVPLRTLKVAPYSFMTARALMMRAVLICARSQKIVGFFLIFMTSAWPKKQS